MSELDQALLHFMDDWRNPVGLAALAVVVFVAVLFWEQSRFIARSLRRNLLRSTLTGLATFVLVLVITLVWSVLAFLDKQTEAKSRNLKALVSEKYENPSQMPYAYADALSEGAPSKKGDYRIDTNINAMTWSFYIGTLDPGAKQTRDSILFFFAMEPRKVLSIDLRGKYTSMMDDIDEVSDADKRDLLVAIKDMEQNPYKVIMGKSRLASINKKVGERIKVTSLNYQGLDLEVEICGELPGGRYEQSAVMNYAYLDGAIRAYNKGKSKDQQHPMTDKSLAFVILRVPDIPTYDRVAAQIGSSPEFRTPAVKCETLSSGVASFMDSYKDLLFGMRWLLVPSLLITISLVIANAISISVRERRVEMAVLKVLGFSPNQILMMVLSEALLIGCLSGVASAAATWLFVNKLVGGIAIPIGFFNKFFVDRAAPWWGLAIGAGTAIVGSLLPAWSARSVKVSEVFSKVA
jgi:putative ABC transport system permease protein